MLSDRIVEICEMLERLYEELEHRVISETEGKYGVCCHRHVQLWADPEAQHDMKELEALVGPVAYSWFDPKIGTGYAFKLGAAEAFVVMPPSTSDSRGESDDVSSNPQA